MNSSDETYSFEKGKVEITIVGDTTISRTHFEPGWEYV